MIKIKPSYNDKPTRLECINWGWHRGHLNADIFQEFERVRGSARWIKENIDIKDYVLFSGGEVYFKHEHDLLIFKLKWV
jgi:hypothetical protein